MFRSIFLAFLLVPIPALSEDNMDRRGFFTKLRNSYLEGRYGKVEQRMLQRKQKEKAKRVKIRDRHIRKLVDGLSRRLRHKPSAIKFYAIAGLGMVVWLCYKGSIGCDGKDDDK